MKRMMIYSVILSSIILIFIIKCKKLIVVNQIEDLSNYKQIIGIVGYQDFHSFEERIEHLITIN
jgi:hypothetical protein